MSGPFAHSFYAFRFSDSLSRRKALSDPSPVLSEGSGSAGLSCLAGACCLVGGGACFFIRDPVRSSRIRGTKRNVVTLHPCKTEPMWLEDLNPTDRGTPLQP